MIPTLLWIGALLIATIAIAHRWLASAIGQSKVPPPRLSVYPSLSVIRPVKGLDPGLAENLSACLDPEYPGELETLFVLDDRGDPAYPVVEAIARAHRQSGRNGRVDLLIAGPPPSGRTGKQHAMILGVEKARGELVAFGDSDTRPARPLLRLLVEAVLFTPGAADAFAPIYIPDSPRKSGDVGYALLVNGWYGPSVALAARRSSGLPFIMGELMVFRRDALAAIGGVACAQGQLVDDMYIGARLADAGYRNIMAPHRLEIRTSDVTFGHFLGLMQRWLVFSRNGLPRRFTRPNWLRGVQHWVAFGLLVLAIALHAPLAALIAGTALVASTASQVRLHRRFGGAPIPLKYWWVPLALPLIAPGVALSTLLHRQVEWRGRAYAVDSHGHLAIKAS